MQYEKLFKEHAVKLSDEIGVKTAAIQLGITYYTLFTWRNNRKKYNGDFISAVIIKECQLIIKNSVYLDWKKC